MPRRALPPPVRPRALRPGNWLGIVAPAGPIADTVGLDAGVAALERLGFRVRHDDRILESWRYLAGRDPSRADELVRRFADPEIAGIVALRGGYGSSRIVPHLAPRPLRRHCKVFMGFSDLTTLHLYFQRRFGWVTLHGPMLTSPALHAPSAEAERHLVRLWTDPGYRAALHFPELERWHGGVAEGRLVGGCLSLLVASLGTAYEVETDGAILFLEDLGEPPYRLDRMVTQLRQAGKLSAVAGILLGSFDGWDAAEGGYSVADTLRELLDPVGVPIMARFPAGHGPVNFALPLFTRVRLDADARGLEMLEGAVM
jgi:muramoyltetrapeptide carboxypeptidase